MKIFDDSTSLTEEEKDLVEKTSVYSFEFEKLRKSLEEKYNLIWNIETKQYEKR